MRAKRFPMLPFLATTLSLLFINVLLVTSDFQDDTYKYKSSKSLSEVLELVPNAMQRKPWPNDIFITLAYHSSEQLNYLRFPLTTIWVVYLGNDTTKPVLSEVNIRSGESVHTAVTQFCVEGGFVNDESIACNGVTVRDAISNIVYGVGYTSTRSTATLEDYIYKRSDVISRINNKFQYKHYLEIGCDNGISFDQIKNNSTSLISATCVDPNVNSMATHYLASDDFFAAMDPVIQTPTMTGQNSTPILPRFDVVFVDGLHEANQAYRDTMHALRVLIPGGTILLHDVNPPHEYTAMYPIPTECLAFNWHGDVWKTVVALRLSPDVEVVTLDMDCGIAVVRKRTNRHPLSNEWKEFLGPNPLSMLRWEHLRDHRDELMRLVSLAELSQWLDEEVILPHEHGIIAHDGEALHDT